LSDIHFTALFTSLYCLSFILLLCLSHCIVWHSLYCSVYPKSSKMNDILYNEVNRAVKLITRAVKWINSSTMNVRQYNEVKRAVKWMSDNTLLLCLSHCIVWHSFYCSAYLIVLSDIHFTALFTPLYCLTFILLLCLPHCIEQSNKMNKQSSKMIKQNCKMNKQSSKMNKQSSAMNVRQYNEVNRAVKWMSDNTMGQPEQ
jgi:hypothetical protein